MTMHSLKRKPEDRGAPSGRVNLDQSGAPLLSHLDVDLLSPCPSRPLGDLNPCRAVPLGNPSLSIGKQLLVLFLCQINNPRIGPIHPSLACHSTDWSCSGFPGP